MGARNPEYSPPSCADDASVLRWVREFADWRISACCGQCAHIGRINPVKLWKSADPPETIFDLRVRMKCGQCGSRKFHFKPVFVGKQRN